MNIQRRNFLNRSLLGLLSLGLLPTTLSFLWQNQSSFSMNALFSRLSFSKKRFALTHLNLIFNHTVDSSSNLERSETLMIAGKTVCIAETDQSTPNRKELLASIYQQSANGFKKVVSLNQMELLAMNNMADLLSQHHQISDSKQLKKMLAPVLRTKHHRSAANLTDNENSSPIGYYTENGYCAIKIHGKGSLIKIQTSLLNFDGEVMYQNSIETNIA